MSTKVMSKKRKFVAAGLLHAELNEFFQQHLSEKGYSGCEVRTTPARTEIVLRATSTNEIVGKEGRDMNDLTELVRKRFNFEKEKIAMFAEAVPVRGLCAIAQAESLKFKLISGLAVRRAAYGVMRQVMGAGACGCEVVISGKLRGARAKSMKFNDGFMTHSGDPIKRFIVRAVRNVELRQGVLGIKIKIMLPHDPTGKRGVAKCLPDMVTIHEPKEEVHRIENPRTEFSVPKVQPQSSNIQATMPSQDVRHIEEPLGNSTMASTGTTTNNSGTFSGQNDDQY